jgi:site-specific DNA recombinase
MNQKNMKIKKGKIKYGLYVRKSSESEDRQVASIDSQKAELKKLAKELGIDISHTFAESKSAKAPGRPIFNQMIEKIKEGEINGIICWKLDRLARNPIDGGQISWLLQEGIIQEIQTYGKNYLPTDNVLMMAVELGMANQFIRDLSLNVKRGLKDKVEEGYYPGPATVGYKNTPDKKKGKKTIEKDPERFETVRKMFQTVLAGKKSSAQIWEDVCKEWKFKMPSGRSMARSTFYRIISDSFYCGKFEYPKGSGNWYKGKHEPMITEEEFDAIQVILGKKGRPRPKSHIFAYTGMIRCGECGCSIIADPKIKRQKNGNVHHYVYYRCTRKKKTGCSQRSSLEVKELERQVSTILSSIEVPPEFCDWAMKWLKKKNKEEANDRNSILEEQERRYNSCVRKIDALIDMRASGDITEEQFKTKKKEAEEEKEKIKELLGDTDNRVNDWLKKAEETLDFAQKARQTFENGDMERKKEIVIRLGSNLYLKDKIFSVSTEKTLLRLKEASKEVRLIHGRLEPLKMPENKAELENFYEKSPVLLRG